MGPGIEAGLGQGGACGPRMAPSVPDFGLGLEQGGGRVAPSVPGTETDFGSGLDTGGECGSAFWVSLSLLLLGCFVNSHCHYCHYFHSGCHYYRMKSCVHPTPKR